MRFRFGPFFLSLDTRQLTRDEGAIHLSPKAFQLLVTLISDRPNVLSKAVLQERLWPDTFVAEANVSNLMAEIREALGDRGRTPLWIRTAHGFGYAFCGDALVEAGAAQPTSGSPTCWLQWGRLRFPLSIGEHVIGRDPELAIRLDASTVSRRHARLVVTAEGASLEDFGSKNGTLRGGERVTSRITLADGDTIHIGSLLLTYHVRPLVMSTDTQAQAAP